MQDPFDKHRFAEQPTYHSNPSKIKARWQLVEAYRKITGLSSVPKNKGYWTLCNKQPDAEGAEIVQLVSAGFIDKVQFFGIDNDIRNEGVIDSNRKAHPEANWFLGDWLEMIEDNFEVFNPALVYFDYTKSVTRASSHIYVARTLNYCPSGTVVGANLMLSDGHSSRRFSPSTLIESVGRYVRDPQDWLVSDQFYSYKSSRTEMGTFVFTRK